MSDREANVTPARELPGRAGAFSKPGGAEQQSELSRYARELSRIRWEKDRRTPQERHEAAVARGKAGGRPMRQTPPESARRCFCGADSMWRACSRNFSCCRKAGVMVLKLKQGQRTDLEVRKRDMPKGEAGGKS